MPISAATIVHSLGDDPALAHSARDTLSDSAEQILHPSNMPSRAEPAVVSHHLRPPHPTPLTPPTTPPESYTNGYDLTKIPTLMIGRHSTFASTSAGRGKAKSTPVYAENTGGFSGFRVALVLR